MQYAIISVVALVVSTLTLFSGFGLGTLLMPAFAIFFPVSVAVAATAVVHLANNLFKIALIGKNADWKVTALFAIPAAVFSVLGALLLNHLSNARPIVSYHIGGSEHEITAVKILISVLIAVFALLELLPTLRNVAIDRKYLPLGGVLSGFFGGLSGLQGALRSAFLIKAGLTKEAYIATAALSAVVVDVARLIVYGLTFFAKNFSAVAGQGITGLVIAGVVAAFIGSFVGVRLMKTVTMKAVQMTVGVLLLVTAALLATGLV